MSDITMGTQKARNAAFHFNGLYPSVIDDHHAVLYLLEDLDGGRNGAQSIINPYVLFALLSLHCYTLLQKHCNTATVNTFNQDFIVYSFSLFDIGCRCRSLVHSNILELPGSLEDREVR